MKQTEKKQAELQSDIQRFDFQLKRWNQVKGLLIAFREENLDAPKGYKENAEKALINVLSVRQKIKANREQLDVAYMQKKKDKYVLSEKYEMAAQLRDRINFLLMSNKKSS